MTEVGEDSSINRRKLARDLFLAAALLSATALANTWDRLPIEEVYAAADTVAYVQVESAGLVREGSFGCGARCVATTIAQFKGEPATKITFFGYSGVRAPAVGGEYLLRGLRHGGYLSGSGLTSAHQMARLAASVGESR